MEGREKWEGGEVGERGESRRERGKERNGSGPYQVWEEIDALGQSVLQTIILCLPSVTPYASSSSYLPLML